MSDLKDYFAVGQKLYFVPDTRVGSLTIEDINYAARILRRGSPNV